MYLNFEVDGFYRTSKRCSEKTAPAILSALCQSYSVRSAADGILYGYTAGHGCTSERAGSWSLTQERMLETWSYQDQVAQEHRAARAAAKAAGARRQTC